MLTIGLVPYRYRGICKHHGIMTVQSIKDSSLIMCYSKHFIHMVHMKYTDAILFYMTLFNDNYMILTNVGNSPRKLYCNIVTVK